jgi:hypothetical protein
MSTPVSPIPIAQSALEALLQGLQTRQWQALRDRLTKDVTLWFPKEPFQGVNHGQEQTIDLLQSIDWDPEAQITIERVTCNGTTVMLELHLDRPGGNLPGFERAAISFEIRNGQVAALQPYLLFFHPAQP